MKKGSGGREGDNLRGGGEGEEKLFTVEKLARSVRRLARVDKKKTLRGGQEASLRILQAQVYTTELWPGKNRKFAAGKWLPSAPRVTRIIKSRGRNLARRFARRPQVKCSGWYARRAKFDFQRRCWE
jgi:hypothetical protein